MDKAFQAAGVVEGLKVHGSFELLHRNAAGEILDQRTIKNLVVDVGKAGIAGLINGVVTNFYDYMAIGTGTTAAAAGDTALGTEISTSGGARALATLSRVTTTDTNDTAQFVLTYSFTGSFAVTEAGLFDASAAGNLLCRQVFSAVNVANGDSLQITWKVQIT